VGRDEELRSLAALFAGGRTAVWLQGPGGIGKTELLRHFARKSSDEGVRVAWMEGDDLLGGKRTLEAALRRELGLAPEADWQKELGSVKTLVVLDGVDPASGVFH
jgi:adenylylsulfate kinase-like enzyme